MQVVAEQWENGQKALICRMMRVLMHVDKKRKAQRKGEAGEERKLTGSGTRWRVRIYNVA